MMTNSAEQVAASPAPWGPGPESADASPVRIAAAVIRNLPVLVGVAVVFAIAAVVLGFARGWEYRATSVFQPAVSDASSVSRLSALAAQFGVTGLSSTSGGESVQFYEELVESRELLREVVTTPFTFPTGGDDSSTVTMTLVELYDPDAPTEDGRIRAAITHLLEELSSSTNLDAGLITVRSDAENPTLAVQINRKILELVNTFNLERRQSQVAAERRFVQERLGEAREQMRAAEERLQSFLTQNRTYQTSPQLSFEAARLERDVELHQQVYGSLAQAFEQAQIDEVRNTPVVTVIDSPEGSAVRMGGPLRSAIWGFVMGLIAASGYVVLRSYLAQRRARHPEEFAEIRKALREVRPAQLLKRR